MRPSLRVFSAKQQRLTSGHRAVLIGPVKAMAPAGAQAMLTRASTVRAHGLSSIVSAIANSATSSYTKLHSPLSLALIRALVLPTPIEGYARACEALASGVDPDWDKIQAEVLVVGGEEDYMSTPEVIAGIVAKVKNGRSVELAKVGHWHAVEQPAALADLMDAFFAL